MVNGFGIETPANKLATALATFGLTIRLSNEVNLGRINASIYKHEVIVDTGDGELLLPVFHEGNIETLKCGIFNLVLIALSASALTADETLDEVFGKISEDVDPSRIGIRVMVNQLRNAFAHNPWRPKWVIRPQYRKKYFIVLYDGKSFTFDSTILDGQSIKPEQVGGLDFWLKLLQHCEKLMP